MIDFNDITQRLQAGNNKVESLQAEEGEILKHYCSMLAEELLKAGSQMDAPFEEVAINSLKTGIALGLGLTIVDGEVLGRPT